MHQRLRATDRYLQLFFYFICGLLVATGIAVYFLQHVQRIAPPPLPPYISSTTNYVWSPDFTKIAFEKKDHTQQTSQLFVVQVANNTKTLVATLSDEQSWFGSLTLAWLTTSTLAYSYTVTDDSLPNWEIVNNSTINQTIWQNRDIISMSPDYKKILTTVVPSGSIQPSEALEYEIVLPTHNTTIATNLNALTTECAWRHSNQLICKDLNSKIETVYPLKFNQ